MTLRWTGTVVALLAAWGLGCDGGGGGSGSQDTAPLPDAMAEVAPDTGIPDTVPEVGPDTVEPPDSVPELVPDIPAPPDTLDTVEADAPQPCATHVECDDGDPCTGDFCTGGACTHQAKNCSDANLCTTDLCSLETGQCYYQLVDCDDGDECTLDSCKPATGCEHLAVNGCCEPDVVAEWGFEEEIPGLDIVNLQEEESPGVTWSVSTARAASGAASLYFGDPETLTYDSGHRVRALALLPPVTVPAGFDAELRVRVWPDVEQSKDWDTFTVLVQVGEQRLPVLVKNLQTDYQAWNEWTVLLNPFAGQSVRVGFHFDSMDGGDNLGEGIYVDDVRLAARCPVASPCIAKVDCSDMNNCTAEACQAGACVYTPDWNCCLSPTHCDDDDVCTIDVCEAGTCIHTEVMPPFCCYDDGDCDDLNVCTDDVCFGGACFHTPSTAAGCCETDADCDDDSSCTVDSCEDSGCVYVNTCCYSDEECDDFDDVCTVDHCVNGACVYQPTGVEGCCVATYFRDDFSTDLGWTYDQNWERGEATVSSGGTYYPDPADDHTTTDDDYIAGVVIGGNAPTSLGGFYWITSPVINISAATSPHLSLWRWLNSDYTPYMQNKVEAFNGTAWTTLWATGGSPGVADFAWTRMDLDVTAQKSASFRIRVGYNVGSSGVYTISQWNVDDVIVYEASQVAASPMCCTTTSDCQGIYAGSPSCTGGQCIVP